MQNSKKISTSARRLYVMLVKLSSGESRSLEKVVFWVPSAAGSYIGFFSRLLIERKASFHKLLIVIFSYLTTNFDNKKVENVLERQVHAVYRRRKNFTLSLLP